MNPPKKRVRKTAAPPNDAGATRGREALLAGLTSLHENFPTLTLAQYLIVLEVLVAESRCHPHTLTTVRKKLGLPHSTASRLVSTLTAAGGAPAALRYDPHPVDRRIKYLRVASGAARKLVPEVLLRNSRGR